VDIAAAIASGSSNSGTAADVASQESDGTEVTMSVVLVELSGVSKKYGLGPQAMVAVQDVDLRVRTGEFVSLMGPSGSGKTTLLNLIAGLDEPDTGEVVLQGNVLRTLRDHELSDLRLRTIGFVFQSFNLLPALTVADNVGWPLEFAGCRRADIRLRVQEALARVGVHDRERRFPAELSGGEQQRVAIARAIATRPSLLLADEPTGNLDSLNGQRILDLLRSLNHTDGVTVIMVTHDLRAAMYGDRTVEVRDGRIVRDVHTPPVGLRPSAGNFR
jgi:putative ABC transport system ATP-binding protein